MKKSSATLFLLFTACHFIFGQAPISSISLGKRLSIQSSILEEERPFQVYLPPSYFYQPQAKYPVVYIMDGDYNFLHYTGLINALASVGEVIPELILVGISDKGATKYRKYCTPNFGEGTGEADLFIDFIDKELKPYITENFRISDYDIITGHSMGGLFVTNYFLEQPKSFDHYIAIDPSLWKNDYEIWERADSIFKQKKSLEAQLYISLADTKGMGVLPFVGVLDQYFPDQKNWKFFHLENENHGSVGLPTLNLALRDIFQDWRISSDGFLKMTGAEEVIEHYENLAEQYSTPFAIPPFFLRNIIYYYSSENKPEELKILGQGIRDKIPHSLDDFELQMAAENIEEKELEYAEQIYFKIIERNPMAYLAYDGLSKIYTERKDWEAAKEMSNKSIEVAIDGNARQWMLNELNANLTLINNLSKD